MTSPRAAGGVPPRTAPCLSTTKPVTGATVGTAFVAGGLVTGPTGDVPDAVAVFATTPVSTSACVTVYGAVHTTASPGSRVEGVHSTRPPAILLSVTATLVTETLPVFVTVKR